MVRRIAHTLVAHLPPNIDVQDLIQDGMIGLLDAATRFEPNHGIPFDSYASSRVRGAMLDEQRIMDWVPRSVRKARRDISQARFVTQTKLKRTARPSEMACEMGLSDKEFATLELEAHNGVPAMSLNELADDDESFFDRQMPDVSDEPALKLTKKQFEVALKLQIQDLPDNERRVITMYYGQEMGLTAIGKIMGFTESRASQIKTLGVNRLRERMAAHL